MLTDLKRWGLSCTTMKWSTRLSSMIDLIRAMRIISITVKFSPVDAVQSVGLLIAGKWTICSG